MCECHFEFEGEVEFPPFHFEFKMCECHLSSKGKWSFLHSILSFLGGKDV